MPDLSCSDESSDTICAQVQRHLSRVVFNDLAIKLGPSLQCEGLREARAMMGENKANGKTLIGID